MNFDFSYVKKQPVNFKQINIYLQKAYKSIESAKKTEKTSPEDSFVLAYESMLKTSLALMLSCGYRPRVKQGHHKTLVYFAKYVLKDKFARVTATYDRMRRKRHKLIYDVASVSETEAREGIKVAEKYFKLVEEKIDRDNPQQKLWKP